MLWNMYYLDKRPNKIISRYIGQMEARSAEAAEKLVYERNKTRVARDEIVARDPKYDNWQPPSKRR